MKTKAELYFLLKEAEEKRDMWYTGCNEHLATGKEFPLILDDEEKEIGGMLLTTTNNEGKTIEVVADKIKGYDASTPVKTLFDSQLHIVAWDYEERDEWIRLGAVGVDGVNSVLRFTDWDKGI